MEVTKIVTPEQTQKKYYVYVHKYPKGFYDEDGRDLSGIVFYVGKGTVRPGKYKHEIERIDQHEYDARSGISRGQCGVIHQIWDKGMEVVKEKVYETDVERDALIYEWAGINMIWSSPYLMNMRSNVYYRERRDKERREACAQIVEESKTRPERTHVITVECQEMLVELAQEKHMRPRDYLEWLIETQFRSSRSRRAS